LENEPNTEDAPITEIRNMKIFKMYFSHVRLYMPPNQQQEKNKQDSKDDAIVIVDEEEESNKSKKEAPLVDEGIKDELKEETRVVQDIEQGDEDIEEENNLEE
jgi:hypothetical protein